jgi:hypothetical protein
MMLEIWHIIHSGPPRGEPEAMLLDGSALDDEERLLVSVQAAAERRLGT